MENEVPGKTCGGERSRPKLRRSGRFQPFDENIIKPEEKPLAEKKRPASVSRQQSKQDRRLRSRRTIAPVSQLPERPPQRAQSSREWASLQEDLLILVVQKVGLQTACMMRLVCKPWKRAVEQGLSRLQSDTAWGMDQLRTVQQTFPRLETLDLQTCGYWTSALHPLHAMTNLRHLRLCRLTTLKPVSWLLTLSRLKQLQTLALPWCGMKQVNLPGYKDLQRLDLTNCSMLEDFSATTDLPSLKCLNLRECQRIKNWDVLQRMPNLEALDLSYCCQVGDEQMELLASLKHLELLVIMHCRGITAIGLTHLVRCRALCNVYMDGCAITEAQREAIMTLEPRMNIIKFSL